MQGIAMLDIEQKTSIDEIEDIVILSLYVQATG